MPKLSPRSPGAPSRRNSLVGALLLSLTLPGCASTQLSQPVKVVTVNADCPRLSISPDLLTIRPLTPIRPLDDNGTLEDTVEIMAADHGRDRGQLKGLTSAEKQRESDQAVIDAQCKASAEAQKAAIEEASKETVKVRIPIWKRLGL